METAKTLLMIAFSILIAVGGQFCLKHGVAVSSGRVALTSADQAFWQILGFFQEPFVWVGLGLYGLGAVAWMVVLSRADISYAYPMLAFAYVIATVLAVFVRHEDVSLVRWLGVLLIALGVVAIGLEPLWKERFSASADSANGPSQASTF